MNKDLQIFDLIAEERARQTKGIELIASENFVSETVMEANGTPLTKRNTVIVASARMENIAEKRNTPRMTFSLAFINPYRFFILL